MDDVILEGVLHNDVIVQNVFVVEAAGRRPKTVRRRYVRAASAERAIEVGRRLLRSRKVTARPAYARLDLSMSKIRGTQ